MTIDRRLERYPWYRRDPDEWVREVVAAHFEPGLGSPYWIRKARELAIDARSEIRTVSDLTLLGPMDTSALYTLPAEEFLPRRYIEHGADLILVESSGTTGPPKTATFTRGDFFGAFVANFRPVAERAGFPIGGAWLFVGPTGPHAIGRAAREVPRTMGNAEPFTVDFDPRWVRKFPEGSVARQRYMAHLVDQARAVMNREEIVSVFATPPTLFAIAEELDPLLRERVGGIHFGGMEVTPELRAALRGAFGRAVTLSGYGNSLFGVALEMGGDDDRPMDYFPAGPRHIIRVLKNEVDLSGDADYGEEGRIVMSRLDFSGFYPNVIERDLGTRVEPSAAAREQGFLLDGVRDPHPPRKGPKIRTGFY